MDGSPGMYVRVVSVSYSQELQESINEILAEELANDAKLVDIKLSSTMASSSSSSGGFGNFPNEERHVALILLRKEEASTPWIN